MKKKKWIWLAVLCLLLALAAGAGIYFYPVWRWAKILTAHVDSARFTYELEIALDKEALEPEQEKLVEVLAKVTGYEVQALCHFTVGGSVWEDTIHMLFYPENSLEPIFELYIKDDTCVVNEAMFLNVIRNNLVGESGILNHLIPSQKENVYMTMEQIEQLLDMDLSSVCNIGHPFADKKFSAGQYFAAMALMSRTRQGDGELFEAVGEQGMVRLEGKGNDSLASMKIVFSIQDPGVVPPEIEALLSRIGTRLPVEKLRVLKAISGSIMLGEGSELSMPTNYIDQDIIDLLSGILGLTLRREGN